MYILLLLIGGGDASIVDQRKQVDIIHSSLHKYDTFLKLKMGTQP